jgi:pimeloyl-ACP methyl ester carboxylesterase
MSVVQNINSRLILCCLLLLLSVACSNSSDNAGNDPGNNSGNNGTPEPSLQAGDYVEAGAPATVSAIAINSVLEAAGGSLNVRARYNVQYFKITYKTKDPDGNVTDASGIIAVPQKNSADASPLLSLQHGTIVLDSDAPSNENLTAALSNSSQALFLTTSQAVVAASLGYLVVAADYLGYGESTLAVHPYMNADSLATTVIDLIVAARHYFADNNIAFNNQVFLGGYSEGGYATLAAQKKLQELYSDSITVTASAPGAGAYRLSQTASEFAGSTQLSAPDNVAFIMKAYDTVYDLNRLGDFFQSSYVDFIDSAFYGDTDRSTIAAKLPDNPQDLFNSVFLQDFTGDGESDLKALFAQNDIYDWSPIAPTYFFHGRDDTVVPYLNMEAVKATMADSPAMFIDCDSVPSSHGNCFLPYLQFAIDSFGALAADL